MSDEAAKPDAQQANIESDQEKAIAVHGPRIARHAKMQCWSPQEASNYAAWDR